MSTTARHGQLPLALKLDAGATFGSFHPGPNAAALDQVRRAVDGEGWLFLWGAPGTGRTHLLNAACQAAGGAGRTACLLPLERADAFSPLALEGLAGVDLVALDDVDRVAGHREWEEALFHLLNALRDGGTAVLMSAVRRPHDLALTLPDLRSRLGWGTLVRLDAGDDADRIQALRLRARLRGLELPEEAAGYLLRRVPRDLKTLMHLLDTLDAASLSAKRRLTVPFLREVLASESAGD